MSACVCIYVDYGTEGGGYYFVQLLFISHHWGLSFCFIRRILQGFSLSCLVAFRVAPGAVIVAVQVQGYTTRFRSCGRWEQR